MRILSLSPIRIFFVVLIIYSNNSYAKNERNQVENSSVSTYVMSDSFSNILPIKQLIEDDWKQAPADDSSIGFTQNEVGLTAYWQNFSINLAHRLDYFVFTSTDTAKAFYLERTDQPLTSQDSYQLSLKLHHQRSNGIRLGYQWQFEHFSTEINIGYWNVNAARESQITGEIFGDEHNNITGTAELKEFYSDKNFLKRDNFNRWDIDGYGLTLDFSANWQVSDKLDVKVDIKDLYSQFKMKNLGYSRGNIDTDGTFINSIGGKSYLPLYRGIESANDYQFDLPERINLIARYQGNTYRDKSLTINYLARYKRQGEVDFYYAGLELALKSSTVHLMLDLEHLSPEIQYSNEWLNVIFAIDEFSVEKAMQFTLGFAVNYTF